MKPTAKNTPLAPVLLAALAGTGAGLLAGVLLAPSAGTLLRQNLRAMGHKYALLASEQQQEFSCHLAKHTAALSKSCQHLTLDMQGHLHQWGLLSDGPRRPY